MRRATRWAVLVSGILVGSVAAWADTALVHITPKNLEENKFTLTSQAGRKDTVDFVIRRNIRGIDGPGHKGYVSDFAIDSRGLGTAVKLEREEGKTLTFRFSVPAQKVAQSAFTLWGQGMVGEGVTFRFKLADFWKPKKD